MCSFSYYSEASEHFDAEIIQIAKVETHKAIVTFFNSYHAFISIVIMVSLLI